MCRPSLIGLLLLGAASAAVAFVAPLASRSTMPLADLRKPLSSRQQQQQQQQYGSPGQPGSSRRGRAVSMLSPGELWQGYMGLIDTHPLITKVSRSGRVGSLGKRPEVSLLRVLGARNCRLVWCGFIFDGYYPIAPPQRIPRTPQCATSAVIVPLGDLSAQAIESYKAKKAVLAAGGDPETEVDGVDWVRVLRFVVFGATLQPIWNHYYFQVRGTNQKNDGWMDGWTPWGLWGCGLGFERRVPPSETRFSVVPAAQPLPFNPSLHTRARGALVTTNPTNSGSTA